MERAVLGANCGGSVSEGWFLITGCITEYASVSAETGAEDITLLELQTALTGVTWGLMPDVSSRTDAGDTACWVGGQATFEDGLTPTNRCYTIPTDHAVVVRFPKSAVGLPVVGNGQVTLFWNAPSSGGTPTSYLVTAYLASNDSITAPVRTCAPSTLTDLQCTVTGLTNGTAYKFRVVAINGDGSSAPSPFTLPQTPVGPPAAPVGEVAVVLPPPSTPPPTTPPVTTVSPAPVAGVSGVVSRVPVGEREVVACAPVDGNGVDTASATSSNCVAETVEVVVENFDQDLVVRGADFDLRLSSECAAACQITSDDEGRQILEFEVGGRVRVAGAGFVPGSTANVWLFSDPKFLGSVEVDPDGSFAGSLSIGQIEVGEHTIQVNGVSADGRIRAVSLGIKIREPLVPAAVSELPQAGVEQGGRIAAWSVLFLALGALMWLVARRPEEDYSGR
jgi:hypothetical protein